MKIKYAEMGKAFRSMNTCVPEKLNIFINLESVLKNLSTIQDLERKIFSDTAFNANMVANIMNLAGHYKAFFKMQSPGCRNIRVILYMTDLMSTTFPQRKYVEDYRMYYSLKYTRNPKFSTMGEAFCNKILPTVREICNYTPGIYLVTTKNVDSSVVPLYISKMDTSYMNLLISEENLDSVFSDKNNFYSFLLRNGRKERTRSYTLESHLMSLLKKPNDDYVKELELYKNPSLFLLLFSVMGDVYRSIDGVAGIGNMSLVKLLDEGIQKDIITESSKSITTLIEIFPSNIQDQIKNNFLSLDMEHACSMMSKEDEYAIRLQLVDEYNPTMIDQMNATICSNLPIVKEALLD